MSSRGGIRVARQRIHVGLPHAGRIVTIELGDTTLRIIDSTGELLTTAPRNGTGEISRYKAHGSKQSPLSRAEITRTFPRTKSCALFVSPFAHTLDKSNVSLGSTASVPTHNDHVFVVEENHVERVAVRADIAGHCPGQIESVRGAGELGRTGPGWQRRRTAQRGQQAGKARAWGRLSWEL